MEAVTFDIVMQSNYNVNMVKDNIQIKLDGKIKTAIEEAARRRGRKTGPWLVYLAALADAEVAKAMGVDAKAE